MPPPIFFLNSIIVEENLDMSWDGELAPHKNPNPPVQKPGRLELLLKLTTFFFLMALFFQLESSTCIRNNQPVFRSSCKNTSIPDLMRLKALSERYFCKNFSATIKETPQGIRQPCGGGARLRRSVGVSGDGYLKVVSAMTHGVSRNLPMNFFLIASSSPLV